MKNRENRYYTRRIRTSYVSTVISITLVLFMMGLLGLVVLNAKKLADYAKENIGFSIMIKDGVKEAEIFAFQKKLDREEFVKSSEYTSKEEAAIQLKKDLGEDFIGFLGYNPLLPTITLHLKAGWANPENVDQIEKKLLQNPEVKEVFYQKSLVEMVNQNIERISIFILGFSLILLVISVALIHNTIRLSVYSKRFHLRTMQLVGATRAFICRPFVRNGFFNGLISALIALSLLLILMSLVVQEIPELLQIADLELYAVFTVFIIALGVLLSWLSTWLAVRKYLGMKTDELYR
jgi:cell division transport system permease protein